jgi:uncharacterized membrane protein
LFGSAMAMIEPAINTVAFHIHEKVWNKLHKQDATKTALAHT